MADLSRLNALFPQSVGVAPALSAPTAARPEGESFAEILKSALSGVNNAQYEATQATEKMLSGESQDIEAAMIALEKANISLNMMLEVRNKILEAYQEIMRTQM
jgi:flagellar hook-basal body complex protein FliE